MNEQETVLEPEDPESDDVEGSSSQKQAGRAKGIRISTLYRSPSEGDESIREKRLSHRLEVAENRLSRLHSVERLADARPRLITRRKRIKRSIRLQEQFVADLKTQLAVSKSHTDETRYVKRATSKTLKLQSARKRLRQSISKANPNRSR
ncbi:MAG: hypothetical protein O7E52_02025 [Candidatus Poribacteria bacterium]|nr:hypothetical protein [Candidatus Poribacteria bacterium]